MQNSVINISPAPKLCRRSTHPAYSLSAARATQQHADSSAQPVQQLGSAELRINRRLFAMVMIPTVASTLHTQLASAEEALLTSPSAGGDHATSTIIEAQPQEPSMLQQQLQQPELHPYQYPFSSNLASNLSTRDYWQVIMKTRPPCWQQIAMRIQAAEFEPLSKDLNIPPFADLRQAVLYVPWALLQKDDISGAGDTRKAYRDFEQHVKDLQLAAESAAAGDGDPVRVQQAFLLMSASLDSFLATVPPSLLK